MIYKNRKREEEWMKEKKMWQNENYLDSFDPGTINLQ